MNQYAPPVAEVSDLAAPSGELSMFSAKGRIGRLRYLAYSTGASFVYYIALLMTVFAGAALGSANVLAFATWVLWLPLIWFSVICGIKRCHDMGISGWWCLTLIIPVIVLAWIFWPGSREANRFGPPQPPNNWGVRILG